MLEILLLVCTIFLTIMWRRIVSQSLKKKISGPKKKEKLRASTDLIKIEKNFFHF